VVGVGLPGAIVTQPYQPALSFTSPTPIPRAAILAWIQQACNVQVAWLHAPQKQLGMQGKPGVQAWVYINVSRYKQYGVDDYREQSGVLLAGTVSVTNGSDQVTFSQPQSLNAGDNIIFSSQPGQPYTFQGSTTNSTTATMMFPYTGPSNPVATTLDALAKNLTGQRRITVTCRAESFASEQSAHPVELLEAIRWYGRTFTNNILDLANCSYSDAGEIRTLPAPRSDNHTKIVAVMDLYFNFAVNDFPVGAQAPGDAGTVIETVNESEQLPTDVSTILGTASQYPPLPTAAQVLADPRVVAYLNPADAALWSLDGSGQLLSAPNLGSGGGSWVPGTNAQRSGQGLGPIYGASSLGGKPGITFSEANATSLKLAIGTHLNVASGRPNLSIFASFSQTGLASGPLAFQTIAMIGETSGLSCIDCYLVINTFQPAGFYDDTSNFELGLSPYAVAANEVTSITVSTGASATIVRINGVNAGSGFNSACSGLTVNQITLGATADGFSEGEYLDGVLGRVLVVSGALSAQDIAKFEAFVRGSWGP
jgi:hypothetical protein